MGGILYTTGKFGERLDTARSKEGRLRFVSGAFFSLAIGGAIEAATTSAGDQKAGLIVSAVSVVGGAVSAVKARSESRNVTDLIGQVTEYGPDASELDVINASFYAKPLFIRGREPIDIVGSPEPVISNTDY